MTRRHDRFGVEHRASLRLMDDGQWRGLLPRDVVRVASGPVYHYTDPGGLLGLVQNRELWATEATGMNDLAEVRQGWEFVREWLENQERDWVGEAIEEACRDGHPLSRTDGIFMCCASTRGDDANQWRLYAGAGRGYAVELDSNSALAALAARQIAPVPDDSQGGRPRKVRIVLELGTTASVSPWLHVLYRKAEKTAALDGLAKTARQAGEELRPEYFGDEESFDMACEDLRTSLMTDVARIAQLMKSEGFVGENEVRVIVTTFFDSVPQFRPTQSGVVRYIRLTGAPKDHRAPSLVYDDELGGEKYLPVTSVRLGPLIHAQNNERTIHTLLKRNGLRMADVHTSEVPLRA